MARQQAREHQHQHHGRQQRQGNGHHQVGGEERNKRGTRLGKAHHRAVRQRGRRIKGIGVERRGVTAGGPFAAF